MKVYYSLNSYHEDGEMGERGLFLHFGDTRIKIGETTEDLHDLIEELKDIKNEIEGNF